MTDAAVTIRDLTVGYPMGGGLFRKPRLLRAVNGITLDIPRGSFFGLVGESGCGKSTLGRATLNVAPITEGAVSFHAQDGTRFDMGAMDRATERAFRRRAQLIFQDPYAALSPRMTVRDIIAEPLEVMKLTRTRAETDARVREVAAMCRLNVEHLRRFPHAFSGGQRQRISIARALAANPDYLVADESVAALDVSIQADILNLMKQLQRDLGLTFLFISHDLSVVDHTCDTVAVMYLGKLVEVAPPRRLFAQPRHPYTQALLSAIPSLDPDDRGRRVKLQGEVPSPANPPSGCPFHPRCPVRAEVCERSFPGRSEAAPGHVVYCHVRG